MLHDNHLAAEPLHECRHCHEPVTNPLCPVCLTVQINSWLTYYPNYHLLKKQLTPKIREFLKKHLGRGTHCIRCNIKRASICPYCFTEFVLNELKKLNVHKVILKEYLVFFNFDLEHKGYYAREAEDLGVI